MTYMDIRNVCKAGLTVFILHMGAYYGLWGLGWIACRLGWVSAWCVETLTSLSPSTILP